MAELKGQLNNIDLRTQTKLENGAPPDYHAKLAVCQTAPLSLLVKDSSGYVFTVNAMYLRNTM